MHEMLKTILVFLLACNASAGGKPDCPVAPPTLRNPRFRSILGHHALNRFLSVTLILRSLPPTKTGPLPCGPRLTLRTETWRSQVRLHRATSSSSAWEPKENCHWRHLCWLWIHFV